MTTEERAPNDALPRAFWRLWLGDTVSSFGSYVTLIALQVLVIVVLHGNAQDVGWLNACRWLPYLLFGLIAGAWVERRRRQPVMVATDLACAIALGAIPVAWWLGVLSVPVLVGIVFLYGVATLLNGAASMAVMPRVIPARQLQRAHSRLDRAGAVAQAAGPAIAGPPIKVLGAPGAIVLDSLSYLFSAAMMASLGIDEPRATGKTSKPDIRSEIRDGVAWIYHRGSALRPQAIGTHIWFVGQAILGVAVPIYALRTLGLSVVQFSITAACAGVGAVVGAVVTTAIGRRLRTGRTVIAAHAVTVVGVVVMALAGLGGTSWSTAAILATGQALHGLAMGATNSHEMAFRQVMTPDNLQARTNLTMHAFNRAIIVVVAPLAGLLAGAAGTRWALIIAACVFTVTVLVLAMSSFRRVDLANTSLGGQ